MNDMMNSLNPADHWNMPQRSAAWRQNFDKSQVEGHKMAKRMDEGTSKGARGEVVLVMPDGSADNRKIRAIFEKMMAQQSFDGQSHNSYQTAAAGAR